MEDEKGVGMPNLTRTLPVHGEDFSLICKYDTGEYSLKDWHVTDMKSINMDVHTKDLPEGYDVIVEHMHADISLVSTSAQLNGITQDSMDNSFHGTSQDGFAVDDKTSYYRTFGIEGYTDQFYELWGYAFGGSGTIEPLCKENLQKSVDAKYGKDVIAINNVTISGADFDESYNKAVAAKQKAQLEYEQAAITNKKNVEKAESDAKATKIKAQAKADAAVIKAEGNAKANKELNESLTDNVLKSLYLDKWDGALPKASLSGNNTMYDISSLTK